MAATPPPETESDSLSGSMRRSGLTTVSQRGHILEKVRLDGQVAVVTGASPTVGPVVAIALAQAGANLAVGAPNAADASEGGRAVRTISPRARPIAGAATHGDRIPGAVGLPEQIDILVHIVGRCLFNAHYPSIHKRGLAEQAERSVVEAVRLCDHVGERMTSRKTGSLIIITPPLGYRPWPDITAGLVTTALIELTRALAQEWAHTGVRINAVTPAENARDSPVPAEQEQPDAKDPCTPPAQGASLQNLTNTVLWLAADASSQVTGAHISIDHGQTIAVAH